MKGRLLRPQRAPNRPVGGRPSKNRLLRPIIRQIRPPGSVRPPKQRLSSVMETGSTSQSTQKDPMSLKKRPGEKPLDEEVPDERRVSASSYPQISEQTDWDISRRELGEASAQKQPPSIPAGDGMEENQQLEPETAHGAPDPDGAGLKEVRGETETRSRAGTGEQAACRVDKITCSEILLEKTTEEKIEDPKSGGKGEERELPLLPPWGREQHSRSTGRPAGGADTPEMGGDEAERGPSGGASRRPGAKPPGFRPPRPRGNRQASPTGAEGPSGGAESSRVDPSASAKPENPEIRNLYLAWCQSREPPRKRKRDAFQLPNKKPRPEVHQTGPAPSEPPTLTPEPAAKSEGLSEPPGISNSDPPRPDLQVWPSKVEETSDETPLVKPRKRAKTGPGSSFQSGETPQVFDRRVKDPGKLLPEERTQMLEKAGEAQMVALTMVYQDGTTQLDPEQLLCTVASVRIHDPQVSGWLLDPADPWSDFRGLLQKHCETGSRTPAPGVQKVSHIISDLCWLYKLNMKLCSKLQSRGLWGLFSDMELKMIPVLAAMESHHIHVDKEALRRTSDLLGLLCPVAGVRIHDPQVSGWLLDPADPWSDFRGLLQKHCETGSRTPVPGAQKVSHIISDLCWLYKLNMKLCSKLQSRGLWRLFSDMELKMIPVLAAMESHHIHVDKEALRRTSDLLGAKMKQLEQEAHRAAGQIFLVTSSSQLRTVLFEKLRLHERCESKKLPKTFKQQQSTSEAADLHPLPKIILEHRQAKMKQLEQEAHRAAGQIFLVTSSSQLRTVLFEKLRLHERCESKKLPKTFKQQQSTSEAALLLLQDLHPLPKIILEHRQVHKIKSTFVDGILSCIRSKNYISSTWHQTSAVTGRISSKQPNFQALPRQPLQVRKKQHVHDFCQVELRLLAHLSCDPELLRIFSDPQADVFSMLASQWKGMSVGEVTSEDREHAKRIVYSVVYGA
ncbi:unnamed protein product, partial [Menidia menidia]